MDKNVFFPKLSPWLPRGLVDRPLDQSIIRLTISSHKSILADIPSRGANYPPIIPSRIRVIAERVGRTIGAKPRENEISTGRHERGRLPGGRENVHAGRPSTATLREAAEGPGASAGLRDATGRCAPLGCRATHHAARRIFASGLQKGLSR